MKEKDDLSKKIKSSFQQQQAKAPDKLWNAIADNLPEVSVGQEPLLDQKIRTSFKQTSAQAPDSVWQAINQQLNIDRTWKRIEHTLDERPALYWRYLPYAAAIVLLVLFWFWKQPAEDSQLADTEKTVTTTKAKPQTNQVAFSDTEKRPASSLSDKLAPQQAGIVADLTETDSPTGVVRIPQPNHTRTPRKQQENSSAALPASNSAGPKETIAAAQHISSSETTSFAETLGEATSEPALGTTAKPPHFTAKDQASSPELGARTFMMLPISEASLSIAPIKVSLAEEKQAEKIRRVISAGPVLSYNNSWLINNETRNSFREGSLIASQLSYQKTLGAAVYLPAGSNSSWIVDFQFIGKDRQSYKLFEGGEYKQKEVALNYYKTGLQFQYCIKRIAFLSDLTLRAGLFGGVLDHKEGDLHPQHNQYKKFNAGFRLGLGQEKQLGNVIIGYGLAAEKGLMNIYKGTGSIPARFNKTYTFNAGPYLNFRYRFLQQR